MNDRVGCVVTGCAKALTRGRYCMMHAQRLRVYGSLDDPPRTASRKLQQQAIERLRTPEALMQGECWEWPGSRQKNGAGYGLVAHSLRVVKSALAHRNAYAITFGEIPDDMLACHHCDNPPCFRPSHLFLGTQSENMRDMAAKGRGGAAPRWGSTNPTASLTRDDVLEAVRLRSDGLLYAQIAERFGVNHRTISDLFSGRTGYLREVAS